jgi:hypothetical protein
MIANHFVANVANVKLILRQQNLLQLLHDAERNKTTASIKEYRD